MTVAYNKRIGALLIGLSNFFILGYTLTGDGNVLRLFLNLLMPIGWLIIGLIILTQTYFVVNEQTLIVNPFLGPMKEHYTFQSLQDVSIEHNELWIRQGKHWQRPSIQRWLVNKRDWQALINFVHHRQEV